MQRQPLVYKRIVGGQQTRDIPVRVEDAADEKLELAPEVIHEIGGVVRKQVGIRIDELQAMHVQPLERKIGDQRMRARIGEQAAHLLLQHLRLV